MLTAKPSCSSKRDASADRHETWSRLRWTWAARFEDDACGLRTAKSCGPDAPTLASSLAVMIRGATVAIKPGHRGEHINRKPLRRECRIARLNLW